MGKDQLLAMIRGGQELTARQRLALVVSLSMPAMLSQLSTIVEEYVDAMMVGQMGAAASASIGLVSTSIWLIGGLSHAASTGFYVQVAHRIGANDFRGARDVFRQGITACLAFCSVLVAIGIAISPWLPMWLGGDRELWRDATLYFAVFCLSMPLHQMCSLAGGVLRCAGHVKVPAYLQVLACVLNIGFNYLFIFVFGLGVLGAAIGTCCAELVVAGALSWYAIVKCPEMNLLQDVDKTRFRPTRITLLKSLNIAGPMGIEHVILCGAQIVSTIIVAPLGTVALAANSFGIIIESLCYMPGYGIADAATTLVGQSLGAGRKPLARQFAHITVAGGIAILSLMAVVMFVTAPWVMQFMSPDVLVQELTTRVLRIEAFAEPMFAASIVCYGIFVGAGDTKVPCAMNLGSIWIVRITLAALLAGTYGLTGVWIAMAIELTFRGIIFLVRLRGNAWLNKFDKIR